MLTQEILSRIVLDSRRALGSKLLSVVLYGSHARGDHTDESDVDVALFVNEDLDKAERERMIRCFSDLCMEYDMVFSPNDITKSKYDQWVSVLPYYQNIRKEGVVLWAA